MHQGMIYELILTLSYVFIAAIAALIPVFIFGKIKKKEWEVVMLAFLLCFIIFFLFVTKSKTVKYVIRQKVNLVLLKIKLAEIKIGMSRDDVNKIIKGENLVTIDKNGWHAAHCVFNYKIAIEYDEINKIPRVSEPVQILKGFCK